MSGKRSAEESSSARSSEPLHAPNSGPPPERGFDLNPTLDDAHCMGSSSLSLGVPEIPDEELEELEETVQSALRRGSGESLDVLGYGEITLVLGWPPGRREWAVKRLPVFDSRDCSENYRALFFRYIERLRERGISVVPTAFRILDRGDSVVAYLIQPRIDDELLLVRRLGSAAPEEAESLLSELVNRVCTAVDEEVGLDAQVSNWMVVPDGLDATQALGAERSDASRLLYFDVSTPLLRDEEGAFLLDVDVFLASLPAILRWPVKAFLVESILSTYHDPWKVLLDVAGNLYKDRLERLIERFCRLASEQLGRRIEPRDALAYHRRDAVLWTWLQRARRVDRFWQLRIRHRPYPYLLPPRTYAGARAG